MTTHKMQHPTPFFQMQGMSGTHYVADQDGLINDVQSVDRPGLFDQGCIEIDGVPVWEPEEEVAEDAAEADEEATDIPASAVEGSDEEPKEPVEPDNTGNDDSGSEEEPKEEQVTAEEEQVTAKEE